MADAVVEVLAWSVEEGGFRGSDDVVVAILGSDALVVAIVE